MELVKVSRSDSTRLIWRELWPAAASLFVGIFILGIQVGQPPAVSPWSALLWTVPALFLLWGSGPMLSHNGSRGRVTNKDAYALSSVLLVQLMMIQITFLRVLPFADGWFMHWADQSQERVVYRDFFFPLPPLSLLIEGVLPNRFDASLVAEQCLHAGTWLLLCSALYACVRLIASTSASLFATVLVASVYQVQPYKIVSGYLELCYLFLFAGLWVLGLALKRRSVVPSILAGALFGCAALVKQSVLLALAAVFLVLVSDGIIGARTGRWSSAVIFKVALGFACAILPFIFWGVWLGLLDEAVVQIFSGGGKSVDAPNLLPSLLESGASHVSWWWIIIASASVGVLAMWRSASAGEQSSVPRNIAIATSLTVAIGILGFNPFTGGPQSPAMGLLLLVIGFAVLLLFIRANRLSGASTGSSLSRRAVTGERWMRAMPGLVVLTAVTIGAVNSLGILDRISGMAPIGAQVAQALRLGGLIAVPLLVGIGFTRRSKGQHSESDALEFERHRTLVLVLAAAVAGLMLMDALSTAGGLSYESLSLGVALSLAFLLNSLQSHLTRPSMLLAASLIAVLPLMPLMIAKETTPYVWWGLRDPALIEPSVTIGSGPLAQFSLQPSRAAAFGALEDGVRAAETDVESRLGSRPRTLLGPNIAGLSGSALDVRDYELTCPILWFDVCPNLLFQDDLRRINSDPPEVVVWNIAPDWVMKGHEEAFNRSQPSGVRQIQEWIANEVSNGRYRLIAEIQSGSPNVPEEDWRIEVLARSASRPVPTQGPTISRTPSTVTPNAQ